MFKETTFIKLFFDNQEFPVNYVFRVLAVKNCFNIPKATIYI